LPLFAVTRLAAALCCVTTAVCDGRDAVVPPPSLVLCHGLLYLLRVFFVTTAIMLVPGQL